MGRAPVYADFPEYYTYGINQTSKRCLLLHSCTLMSHVVTGCLHHHAVDVVEQVLAQGQDLPGHRTPRRHRRGGAPVALALDSDADLGVPLGDIDSRAPRVHHIPHISPLPRPLLPCAGVRCGKCRVKQKSLTRARRQLSTVPADEDRALHHHADTQAHWHHRRIGVDRKAHV